MKTIAVLPARFNSSRFPGKPLVDILGKTLLQRTYENTCKSPLFSLVVIATDDQRIKEHAESFGALVVMTKSHPNGTSRMFEVMKSGEFEADIWVNVQADEPLIDSQILSPLIEKLKGDKNVQIATPISLIKSREDWENPSIVKCVFSPQGKALYFSRSPIPFNAFEKNAPAFRHIGVYAYRASFLKQYCQMPSTPLQECEDLEQLKILEHGYPIDVCVVEDTSIGVDTPEDLEKVKAYLCQENISSSQAALSHP